MLKDAAERNDVLTVKLLTDLRKDLPDQYSADNFDNVVLNKIQLLAKSATTHLKKKEKTLGEQDIYCISLLSHCFFNNDIKVSIEDKIVTVEDCRKKF